MLHAYVSKKDSNAKYCLIILEYAYNSAKHVTRGFSPFMHKYGFHPRSLIMVGLANEKFHQLKDFLQDHMDMSCVAC